MAAQWKEVTLGLQSQEESAVISALEKLRLHNKSLGKDTTTRLMPKCIDKLSHHNVVIRSEAMTTIAKQFELDNASMKDHTEEISRRITQPNILDLRAGAEDSEHHARLHQSLCKVIPQLQKKFPKKLMPFYKPLGVYLADCILSNNKEIREAGCEYWAKLEIPPVPNRYMDIWVPSVLTKLKKMVPALINCMVYHQDHIDFIQNITPQTARHPESHDAPTSIETLSNIRNYAALAFENLCKIFQTEIIALFKPLLEKHLNSKDWKQLEAGILALGAFTQAMGTPKDMRDIYPQIIPQVLEQYSHPEPLVRGITCFTMQNFINFTQKGVKDPLPKITKSCLALLGDDIHETRVMAMRSLAATLAYSEKDLSPYSDKIVEGLVKCNESMKGDLRYSYYECIGHLFGRMGNTIEDQHVTKLMEPIMTHWRELECKNIEDRNLEDTVLICQPLSIIATYSKSMFSRYNEAVLEKVASYLDSALKNESGVGLNNSDLNGHLVAMLDVASCVFEGQGKDLGVLASKYKLEKLALDVLKEGDFQERTHQSILALLGHLSDHCFECIEPHLSDILLICARKIESQTPSVKNNTLWTLSGIAKGIEQKNDKLMAFADELADILRSPESDQGMAINAALTVSHLGRKWPTELTSLITRDDNFMMICMLLQMPFQRDLEKITLFQNMCQILSKCIKKLPKDIWAPFCTAIAVCDCSDDELITALRNFLRDLRTSVGNKGWTLISNQIGPQLTITLRKKYKLY